MKKLITMSSLVVGLLAVGTAHAAPNLLTNGGFEASSSQTITPTGWTNIGHSDGVITYSAFGTPAYEGLNFYDLGGFGDAFGPAGDGISQTVTTTAGALYALTFGYSSENVTGSGSVTLRVAFNGGSFTDIVMLPDGSGVFQKPFTTTTVNFLATSASTTISFIELINNAGGNNDPLIDGVSFSLVGDAAVPEPGSIALLGLGLVGLGTMRRQRRKV